MKRVLRAIWWAHHNTKPLWHGWEKPSEYVNSLCALFICSVELGSEHHKLSPTLIAVLLWNEDVCLQGNRDQRPSPDLTPCSSRTRNTTQGCWHLALLQPAAHTATAGAVQGLEVIFQAWQQGSTSLFYGTRREKHGLWSAAELAALSDTGGGSGCKNYLRRRQTPPQELTINHFKMVTNKFALEMGSRKLTPFTWKWKGEGERRGERWGNLHLP